MSIRCKVCNALKIVNNHKNSFDDWECQNCGSMFDSNDNYITVG